MGIAVTAEGYEETIGLAIVVRRYEEELDDGKAMGEYR